MRNPYDLTSHDGLAGLAKRSQHAPPPVRPEPLLACAYVMLLPITSCYECGHRDTMACRCLLTDRKRNRHPREGIPTWCPLPKAKA